ncbi:alpha/beta hydrolase fold domain-containing protein [Mycobacterium sp. NPDC050441]|uniref:alpha/beta hydrolase fold domain-containing protein n=1 Tax=Mycobacterium sp. NPDC050441 TaxID=3155403 RepID=UPI0033E6C34B
MNTAVSATRIKAGKPPVLTTLTRLEAPPAETVIPPAPVRNSAVAAESQLLPAQAPASSLNSGITPVASPPRAVLTALSVTGKPEAPAQSPALWTLLAVARREFDPTASRANMKRDDVAIDTATPIGQAIVKPGTDFALGGNVPAWPALSPTSSLSTNLIHHVPADATDIMAGAVDGLAAELPATWTSGGTSSFALDGTLLHNLIPTQSGDTNRALMVGGSQIRDWATSLLVDHQAVKPNIFDQLGIVARVPYPDSPLAAADAPAFTGQPSLVEQLFVGGLRLVNPILRLAGIELTGSSASIPFISDGTPPFFLTHGLTVSSSEYDGWKVWTLTPANPSGKVVVAVHGGAFVSQVNIFQWWTYTDMARDTGATVVVPLYPLANAEGTGGTAKTVVPTMADFIADQVAEHGADNVSVLGDSVGGTIALAAAQELVRRCDGDETCLSQTLPGHMVLISPFLDLSMSNPNIALVDDPLLSAASSRNYAKLWAAGLGTPDDPDGTKNPIASPLYGSLEGLPPTTVYTGSLDMRAPDVLVLQQRAASTPGTDFEFELRNGAIHDWVIFAFLPDAIAERPGIYEHLGIAGDGDNT